MYCFNIFCDLFNKAKPEKEEYPECIIHSPQHIKFLFYKIRHYSPLIFYYFKPLNRTKLNTTMDYTHQNTT